MKKYLVTYSRTVDSIAKAPDIATVAAQAAEYCGTFHEGECKVLSICEVLAPEPTKP